MSIFGCILESRAMSHSNENIFIQCQNLSVVDNTNISVNSGLNVTDISYHACNNACSNYEVVECNQTCQALNIAQDESKLINQLCNCSLDGKHWCFVHNKVLMTNDPHISSVNDFGFMADALLYTPLFRPATVLEIKDLCDWACSAHSIVKESGVFNYRSARIRVPTELNINNWRSVCANYNDQLILDYLEFGFPLCVNRRDLQVCTNVVNHPSAVNFPEDVDIYFKKELSHKAIVGPCESFPFTVHYSPLLSRPKPDDSRRIIVNLSSPYGASVNDCIDNDVYDNVPFKLKYPSVQDIVDEVNHLNSDVLLSKIDISRAFRNLRVDPHDFDLLGLKWNDSSYLDISIPMGMKTGSALCQRVTDVLRHIMKSKNVKLFNYIDDVICVHKRQNASFEFELLYSLFEFLGIPINPKKVVLPTRVLTCMGIVIDVDAGQLSIPQDKCLEILDLCRHYRSSLKTTPSSSPSSW